MKITETQRQHLRALEVAGAEGRGAYPGLHMGTLSALKRKGLAVAKYGLGSMALPRTSTKWSITAGGRKLLQEQGEDDGR